MSWERLVIEMKVTFDDITNNFELWVAWEWHFAGEHDVEDDAEWPYVNFRVVVLEEHLWGDIVGLSKKRQGHVSQLL